MAALRICLRIVSLVRILSMACILIIAVVIPLPIARLPSIRMVSLSLEVRCRISLFEDSLQIIEFLLGLMIRVVQIILLHCVLLEGALFLMLRLLLSLLSFGQVIPPPW